MQRINLNLAILMTLVGCVAGGDDVEPDTTWSGGKADGQTASGALRITEVHAHPGDASAAFVELINRSDAPFELEDATLSVGRRKLTLVEVAGRGHVLAPQQLAVIIDPAGDPAAIPADAAVVMTTRSLGPLLADSQRLIVRTSGKQSDKADASRVADDAFTSVERTADDGFARSTIGRSPGEQNAINANALAVYFANPPVDTDDPIAPHLIELIDSAQSSLDAAFFQVDNPAVIDAFISAAQRGVKIRFVTDTDYFVDPSYAPGYQRMVAAGIPVIDDKRGALMHSKFMIVDGKAVWTGSYNLLLRTDGPFDHADNALYIKSPALAAIHTAQFEQLFAGTFGRAKQVAGNHDVFVDGVHVEVYFAPTDNLKDHALAAVKAAQRTVHFAVFSFFQVELGAAMIDDASRGVDVRGIFDVSSISATTQYPTLAAAGLDVRRADPAGPSLFLHDKFMVIDADQPSATVVTGSANFSNNAYDSNDEAMYVIHGRVVAAQYEASYHVFYDHAVGPNQH